MKLQLGSHVTTEKGGGHLIARHRSLTGDQPLYVIQLFDGTVCSSTERHPAWMDQVEEISPVTNHASDPGVPAGLRSFLLGDE